MEKLRYDICVIGSGPAGFAATMRSYDFDNHVVIRSSPITTLLSHELLP